jgi:hypothetical protein
VSGSGADDGIESGEIDTRESENPGSNFFDLGIDSIDLAFEMDVPSREVRIGSRQVPDPPG